MEPPGAAEEAPEQVEALKLELVTAVCSALVGGTDPERRQDGLRRRVAELCRRLAPAEPEFLLQVALFARRELGLRAVSCFVVAAAAVAPPCRPHLRRYLGAVVLLPCDWTAVARLYQSLAPDPGVLAPLPRALRDALVRRFAAFDLHQLGKYRGRPGKRPRGPPRRRQQQPPPTRPPARRLRPVLRAAESKLSRAKEPPPLPPSLFSLRSLVRRLHVTQPPQHVRALLGRSGAGPWGRGPRPTLPPPRTWERALSAGGAAGVPAHVTWRRLIAEGGPPGLALLRNLRGLLGAGLDPPTLHGLLGRLEDPATIAGSRLLPSQLLAAHEALGELGGGRGPPPSRGSLVRRVLAGAGVAPPPSWGRRELRAALGVPGVRGALRRLRAQHRRPRVPPDWAALRRARGALGAAMGVAVGLLPPLPGPGALLLRPGGPPAAQARQLLLALVALARAEGGRLLLYGRGPPRPYEPPGGHWDPGDTHAGGHWDPVDDITGGHWDPGDTAAGGHKDPADTAAGGHKDPADTGTGGHKDPADTAAGGHWDPGDTGAGRHWDLVDDITGGHKDPADTAAGGHKDPADTAAGGHRDPADTGAGGHKDPADTAAGGHKDPGDTGAGGHRDPADTAEGGHKDPADTGTGGHKDPADTAAGGHRDPADTAAGGHRDPADTAEGRHRDPADTRGGRHKDPADTAEGGHRDPADTRGGGHKDPAAPRDPPKASHEAPLHEDPSHEDLSHGDPSHGDPSRGPWLLAALRHLRRHVETLGASGESDSSLSDAVWELMESGREVETLLVLSPGPELPGAIEALCCLRRRQLRPCRVVNVIQRPSPVQWESRSDTVTLAGCSEAVLHFLAAGGAAQLVAHVEAAPARHGLAPPPAPPPAPPGPLPPPPPPLHSHWRGLRLFISSTFLDMGGERDALVRAALPRLRALAAPHGLGLQEVDLRWGAVAPQPQQQVELCLEEVSRCDVLVGLLGERYGYVPPAPPEGLPAGRSVTELELLRFLGGWRPGQDPAPALIYMRDPAFLKEVPERHRGDFEAESEEAAAKMADLKRRLREHPGVAAVRSYGCEWGGASGGRPGAGALDAFVRLLVADVWELLQRRFLQPGAGPPPLQPSFLAAQRAVGGARRRLLVATATALRRGPGGRFLVTGAPGDGRTAFLAGLVGALQEAPPPGGPRPLPPCLVAYHFAGARPDQADARLALGHLCAQLAALLGPAPGGPAPPGPASYGELRGRLAAMLGRPAPARRRLVVLVDDADALHEGGEPRDDWAPLELGPRVSLVLSVADGPGRLGPLWGGGVAGPNHVALGPLAPPERAALVRAALAGCGRSLPEDQLRLVLAKSGSRQPLYLALLTRELRAFARHDDLGPHLAALPPTLPALLRLLLRRLQGRHGPALGPALAALGAARHGLGEGQLLAVLGAEQRLGGAEATWAETLEAAAPDPGEGPAPLWELLRDLRWLLEACGVPLAPPGARLHLAGAPLREAVGQHLARGGLQARAHRLLAACLWRACDPDGDGTFRGADAESLAELPYHLAQAELWEPLWALLSDLRFLGAHVRRGALGVLPHSLALLQEAQQRGAVAAVGLEEVAAVVEATLELAREELHAVGQRERPAGGPEDAAVGPEDPAMGREDPAMGLLVGLAQEAANAPPRCPLRPQARALLPHGHRLLLCSPPPPDLPPRGRGLRLRGGPQCLALAPGGGWAAVGTAEGSLHWLRLAPAGPQAVQEVRGSVGGVRAVAPLPGGAVALGGAGGDVEVLLLPHGARLWKVSAHRGPVTALEPSPDGTLLVSAGLDGRLQVWGAGRGAAAGGGASGPPLACVAFHPGGAAVAAGAWGGRFLVLPLDRPGPPTVLARGGGRAAGAFGAAAFAPDGCRVLGAQAGGVLRLWAWPGGAPLGVLGPPGCCPPAGIAWAPPGVVGAGSDGQVLLWPAALGRVRATLRPPPGNDPGDDPALCVTFDPTGTRLAVGHRGGDVWVHRAPWGRPPWRCGAGAPVSCLAWLGPRVLAAGGPGGRVWGWALPPPPGAAPRLLWVLPPCGGALGALAGDPRTLVAATDDGCVGLWPTAALMAPPPLPGAAVGQGPPAARLLRPHAGPTACLALSPDGRRLATGGRDRALAVWPVAVGPGGGAVGQPLRRWPHAHRDWLSAVAWAGELLVSGSAAGAVGLWEPRSGQRLRQLGGLAAPVTALGLHGRRVLGAARDGGVAAWDLPPGSPRTRFRDPVAAPACAAVAPPGGPRALLAMTGADGVTRIWEPLEAAAPRSLGGHCGRVTGLGVFAAPPPGGGPAPRAYVITAADDGTVRVVPLPGPDEPLPEQDPGVRGGPGVRGPVAALAWSPDGALAISGGPGGRLVLWGDGQSLAEATCAPPAVTAVAFCDARRVLVAAGRRLELWEVVEEETARGRRHRLRRGGAMAAAAAAMTGGAPASPPGLLALAADGSLWGCGGAGGLRPLAVTAAGGPRPDAWAPLPDAWAPPADANRPDAGAPEDSRAPEDAWAPRPDAGAPRPDAGAPEDAWAPSPDAGAPEDAWAPAAFRLPGSPVDAQALPDGSVLVWAGATRPHLCRLVPAGEGWRVQDAWALAAPLEPHGPSQWFNGACYIPGAGVFLARSDGTLCVSPGWGDAGAPGAAWRCRKVHGGSATALAALEGPAVATGGADGRVRVWLPGGGGAPLAHFACAGPVSCLEPRPGPRPGLALGDAWGRVYFLRWDTPP